MRGRILCAAVLAACAGRSPGQYLEQPRPRCAVDLAAPYGHLDLFDLLAFLDHYLAGDPRADAAAPWGTLNLFDVIAFMDYYQRGCDADADGDGIPDWAETDDGVFRGPFATGTDPNNPDTDGDGLPDGDEIFGTREGLDLPALGADPLRKDVFVECDWFAGVFEGWPRDFRPRQAAVDRLVRAFADAPVANPYAGADGINIHLDYGQGGPFTGGNQLPGAPAFISFQHDFPQYKAAHFDPRRAGYFHYAVFANRYDAPDNASSGVAVVNGSDFMVTMSNYLSSYNQSQTVMHELGHNLGLRHGGFENRNHKPNYNSVMNYRHQFPGADANADTLGDGVLDYSTGVNNPIDERAIFEPAGVMGVPVDFNRDGVIQQTPYAANLNCPGGPTPCGAWADACGDAVCTVLLDHDDWGSINWSRLGPSNGRWAHEIATCEATPGAN